VAISGNTLVVGAYSSDLGAAYVFGAAAPAPALSLVMLVVLAAALCGAGLVRLRTRRWSS
jgi:hypothetical protein